MGVDGDPGPPGDDVRDHPQAPHLAPPKRTPLDDAPDEQDYRYSISMRRRGREKPDAACANVSNGSLCPLVPGGGDPFKSWILAFAGMSGVEERAQDSSRYIVFPKRRYEPT